MSSPGRDGQERKFNHPYLQACSMFVGEIMCLVAFNIVYFYRKRRSVCAYLNTSINLVNNILIHAFSLIRASLKT